MTRLVIVESPAKAKTIQRHLGPEFQVEASVGHIRDLPRRAAEVPAEVKSLPWANLGVDITGDFTPLYVVDPAKRSRVAELKRLLARSDELLLATDEDREGEAIAWHLMEVLKPKVPVRRMVFHEITREAIQHAVETTRDLDYRLVDAQETRRIVDRLYGYEVSPVLWKKVQPQLSAGRVQSVATRLIVERERERIAFVPAGYWDVQARLQPGDFPARLTAVDGVRVATGRDFDERGQCTREGALILTEAAAVSLAQACTGQEFTVTDVSSTPFTSRPKPPFITSTLQRAASNRLRWNAQRTMRVAQGLYERGFITYMRTDSTTLAPVAVAAAREQARTLFGPEYVPDAPRRYSGKVKNAQEAHEAIRPAGDVLRTPAQVAGELRGDEFALYDLIWQRTLASQMSDLRGTNTTVSLAVAAGGQVATFTASGRVITFPGYRAVSDAATDDDGEDGTPATRLPALESGSVVHATELTPEGHSTKPPARYTEATLVRELESRGVGRPSTYAAILGTIVERGYIVRRGQALIPTWLAFAVVRLLVDHFGELVDYGFTARMEEVLDQISNGEAERVASLRDFYYGAQSQRFPGLHPMITQQVEIDPRDIATFPLPQRPAPDADGDAVPADIVVRVGRYGPYVAQGERTAGVPADLAPDELTYEVASALLSAPSAERTLGVDPATARPVSVRFGRFGPYITEDLLEGEKGKPRTASLFESMTVESLTLEQALALLNLPRTVGVDPSDDIPILARNGRYGPYLSRGSDSRTLDSQDEIFTITLEQALARFAQPKQRRGPAAAAVVRDLGLDPVSGRAVTVRNGRYGPYVTDGEINATLRDGDEVATVTPERAYELIADKRARGPVTRGRKAAVKKAPAKKAAVKKAAVKKAAVKKAAVKEAPAKKAAVKEAPAKKAPAKKAAVKKAPAKKAAVKKAPAAERVPSPVG
ncbi:MAG: type I DNA topoisomerase [Actinomycetales bacterium]|nr:type I DNA topoisomerase [Actinomycetales bacterium]